MDVLGQHDTDFFKTWYLSPSIPWAPASMERVHVILVFVILLGYCDYEERNCTQTVALSI